MIGGGPKKPTPPAPPPSTPTRAQARQFTLQTPSAQQVGASLINTSPQGLLRRANTQRRTLLGGSTAQ